APAAVAVVRRITAVAVLAGGAVAAAVYVALRAITHAVEASGTRGTRERQRRADHDRADSPRSHRGQSIGAPGAAPTTAPRRPGGEQSLLRRRGSRRASRVLRRALHGRRLFRRSNAGRRLCSAGSRVQPLVELGPAADQQGVLDRREDPWRPLLEEVRSRQP